jgi:hypothetical protein
MKREYVSRGRRVTLEEQEGLIAVMPEVRTESRMDIELAFGRAVRRPMDGMDPDDWFAMEKAGWIFVRPNPKLARALETGAPVAGAKALQRVFHLHDGRIYLGFNRLCTQLRESLTEEQARAVLAEARFEILRRLKFAPNLFIVRVPPGRDFLQLSLQLSGHIDFNFVEPDFFEHLPGRNKPTDPDYPDQWHLNNTGQGGGKYGADIKAEDAWQVTCGAGVRLAVIDNGFDINHEDLVDAIAPTSGYFVAGPEVAEFIQGLGAGFPVRYHGTFCAGLAVARADNYVGGCGIAHQATLIAVACLRDQVDSQCTLARAVAYAADPCSEVSNMAAGHGADIISCSLGPQSSGGWHMTETLENAIHFAVTEGRGGLGTPVFWAVNNNSESTITSDEVCAYVNTIAVGSSARNDVASNIATGPELDFLATGEIVLSTIPTALGSYGLGAGTSYATAIAAGVGALILAVKPGLRWDDVRKLMRDTCDKVNLESVTYDNNGRGRNDQYGWGRVNAACAVREAGKNNT